jgi:hypothetical protein
MGCGGSKSNNVEQSNNVGNQSPPRSPIGRAGNESPTDFDYTPTVVHHSPQRSSQDNGITSIKTIFNRIHSLIIIIT